MRFKQVALLVVLLTGSEWLMASSSAAVKSLRTIPLSPESQALQNQAVEARKRLLLVNKNVQSALAKAATDNSAAATQEVDAAQKQAAAAQSVAEDAQKKASSAQSQPVAQSDWAHVQQVLTSEKDRFESSMNYYSGLATALVLLGIGLGLVAAIAGFMRKAMIAGLVSIVVSCVVGIPKVFPISQRAEYYRVLFGQSSNMLIQSQLLLGPTVADYNQLVTNIRTLSEYETSKFPSAGDVASTTEDLIKDMATSAAQ